MKNRFVVIALLFSLVLSGCSIFSSGNQSSVEKTLKEFDLAYSSGNYTMRGAVCSGFITSGQTAIYLSFPVSKRLLDGQTITVTSLNNASIRVVNGGNILDSQPDLTKYIDMAQSKMMAHYYTCV